MTGFLATASIEIDAPAERVWAALTEPDQIKAYMFGTEVETDWTIGNPIVWKGVWEGKPYEDKGEIVDIEPTRRLRVTHFSPLSGQPDVPENYHTLTYELTERDRGTSLSLSQDGNLTADAAEHSRRMWETMLGGLKQFVEQD